MALRTKTRRVRHSIVGREPLSRSELERRIKQKPADLGLKDGDEGAESDNGPRQRTKHTEPLKMSVVDYAAMYACADQTWSDALHYESILNEARSVGRRRVGQVAMVIFVNMLVNQVMSVRKAFNLLQDPNIWKLVVDAVEHAWPDHPERRLNSLPPSRDQYIRLLNRLTDDVPGFADDFRQRTRERGVTSAEFVGCGSVKDSLTHPSPANLITGDGTWEEAMLNGMPGKRYLNRATGELISRRCDPDATLTHKHDKRPGNLIVSVQMRTEFGHERIILDTTYKRGDGGEATLATDMALNIADRFHQIRGLVYDMALSAADQDRIGATGRHVVCHVPRTTKNKVRIQNIGSQKFTKDGRSFEQQVVVIDGCPLIYVLDSDGEEWAVPLFRVQTKARSTTLYNSFEIPSFPIVPVSKRGAITWIRPFSSDEDREAKRLRPLYLRSIPNNDLDFDELFGIREDTESMHNDLKSRRKDRRARSVGLARREFNLRGYQAHQNLVAVVAHSLRTGKDMSDLFGNWRPPERAQRLKAA